MEVIIEGVKYVPANEQAANRVSIYGMYDCHCFEKFTGTTVDEVVDNWLEFIKEPTIATFGGSTEKHDIGSPDLCPAIVLSGDNELRRVGRMVHLDWKTRKPKQEDVDAYRSALKADPDISRILKEQP